MQKLRQNIGYLLLGGINNWLYVIMTIFAQRLSICSPKFEGDMMSFSPLLTRLATVTDGHVVLILLLH